MRMKAIATFGLVACLGCALSAEEEKTGTLGYYKDFDFSGKSRILAVDGQYLTAEAALSYYSRPAGVMDGDGGQRFYLRVKQPDLIAPGVYTLNQSIFEARLAEWASPHYYHVMPDLRGTIRVSSYRKFKHLEAELDLVYSGTDGPKTYRGRIRFENHETMRDSGLKLNWEEFDPSSFRTRKNILASDLRGQWKSVRMFQESNGQVLIPLDAKEEIRRDLIIEPDRLKRISATDYEKFILEENRIKITGLSGDRSVTAVINRITPGDLVLTWIEQWKYDGRENRAIHRIVYVRKQ